jgi:SAP domain-containing new25
MTDALLSRPLLGVGLAVADFDAWEWRKDELIACAKALGVPSRGTKDALSKRIRSQLGRVYPPTQTVITADGVVTPPALKVVEHDSTRLAAKTAPSRTTPPAVGFFKAEPGQSRAQALAAWYAQRNARAGS